jgi:hypothetical protein
MQPDEDLSPGVKRALVLVTKIIQNLASNAKFTEQNTLPLNPFLQSNVKRVLEFIHIISVEHFYTGLTEGFACIYRRLDQLSPYH